MSRYLCPQLLAQLFVPLLAAAAFFVVPPAQAQDTVFFPIVVKQSTSVESKIPDTGIYFCHDGTGKIECPRNDEDFYGQDAHYNPTHQQHRYTDNGDSTVTDEVIGLMWMQYDSGSDIQYTWGGAATFCEGRSIAGHDDWRLPDIKELQQIVDYSRVFPSIHPFFTSGIQYTYEATYWSSTPIAGSSIIAWAVDFYDGMIFSSDVTNEKFVRCVRDGQ